MGWIGNAWRGEEAPSFVVQMYGICLIAIAIGTTFVHANHGWTPLRFQLLLAANATLTMWFAVAVWRCASNASSWLGKYYYRISYSIFLTIGVLMSMLIFFVSQVEITPEKRAEQECRREMREFAKKNGINPGEYTFKNQAYLKECVEFKAKSQANSSSP